MIVNESDAIVEEPIVEEEPVVEPESMDVSAPEQPRKRKYKLPKRRKSGVSRKHKTSKFNAQDIATYSEELAAAKAAALADNPALDGDEMEVESNPTNKRKAKCVDNWKANRTIQSQEKKIKKLTNKNAELETNNIELKSENVDLEHQLKKAHHANYQEKKATRELYLSQLAELEAQMRSVEDEVLQAQLKSIAAEEKAILANQKAKADVRKERAVSKQKLEKELKGKESMKLHLCRSSMRRRWRD